MLPLVEEKEKAIKLRQSGESVRQIAKQLGVSISSVCAWTRDVILSDEQQAELYARGNAHFLVKKKAAHIAGDAIRVKAKETREKYQEQGRIDARAMDPLHMQGCMLYWAEGGKNTNAVRLVNTDGDLVRHFVAFLRHSYKMGDDSIKLRIRSHSGNGKTLEEIKQYWLDILQLPPESVTSISFYYDKRVIKKVKNNKHVYGTCEVVVYRAEIVHRIFGAIQEYGGFSNPKWLERKRG
jgi:transposase-like protein